MSVGAESGLPGGKSCTGNLVDTKVLHLGQFILPIQHCTAVDSNLWLGTTGPESVVE